MGRRLTLGVQPYFANTRTRSSHAGRNPSPIPPPTVAEFAFSCYRPSLAMVTGRDTSRRRTYRLHHEQSHVSSTPEPITSVPAGRPRFKLTVVQQPRAPRARESTDAREQLECSERPGIDSTAVFVFHGAFWKCDRSLGEQLISASDPASA